jgi:hypothetical protein
VRTYVRLRVASEVYAIPVENVLEVAVIDDVALDVPAVFESLERAQR